MLHDEIREAMSEYAGIWRDDERLATGIDKLEDFKTRAANVKAEGSSQYNPAWHEALDLENLLMVSEAVAKAARLRQESRGAHSRVDFEGEREEWGRVNIVVRQGDDGSMLVEQFTRGEPPVDLATIANAQGDDILKMEGPLG